MVTVDILKEFLEAFNKHDTDAILDFFAEDCVMDLPRGPDPWGKRTIGKEQVKEGCNNRFKGLPDAYYDNDRHFVIDNMGFSEWTLKGTSISGKRIEVCGTDHIEFDDESKIVRKNSFWKTIEK